MIDQAALAGADSVKFQTFKAEEFITRSAPKAAYQKKMTSRDASQMEMIRKLELDKKAHLSLMRHCRSKSIEFLSTPFDISSIDLLQEIDIQRFKIPSGEITNGPYLLHIARTGKPVIMSTGMCTLGEIETALGVLAFGYLQRKYRPSLKSFGGAFSSAEGRSVLGKNVVLLQCTSEYPAPYNEVNLMAMETMRSAFGLPVGLSDHTPGIAVPIAAAALGAVVIEKHFTLDRNLPGPDHKASLEPDELKSMITAIRNVESAMGSDKKAPAPSELKNRDIARKSLVASRPIAAGEIFSAGNITAKRPGRGKSPMLYWDMIGEKSLKNYNTDEII